MAALWQIGGIPVYVSEETVSREIKRAELFPLDATASTLQFFGAGSRHATLKGIVTSTANYVALEDYAIADTAVTLVSPWGNTNNCKIHGSVKGTVVRYASGTFDGVTINVSTTPLTEVELEIIVT